MVYIPCYHLGRQMVGGDPLLAAFFIPVTGALKTLWSMQAGAIVLIERILNKSI